MNLDNSGRNVPLYDLLGAQTTDYDVKKLSALVGHDVGYYAVSENLYGGRACLSQKRPHRDASV